MPPYALIISLVYINFVLITKTVHLFYNVYTHERSYITFALPPKPRLFSRFLNLSLPPPTAFRKLAHSTFERLFDLHTLRFPLPTPPLHLIIDICLKDFLV